jgi:DNA-binding MarR family transcriptional regulator
VITVSAVATPPDPEVVAVAENVVRLSRVFNRIRTQFLAAARDDVDWTAHVLITNLAVNGPMRAGALADAVHSDPSTVSRQVGPLVRAGLIERRADQEDGRASVLAVTPKGMQVFAAHQQARVEKYERILEDWSSQDCATFAVLLGRFTDDLERGAANWVGGGRGLRRLTDPEPTTDENEAETKGTHL